MVGLGSQKSSVLIEECEAQSIRAVASTQVQALSVTYHQTLLVALPQIDWTVGGLESRGTNARRGVAASTLKVFQRVTFQRIRRVFSRIGRTVGGQASRVSSASSRVAASKRASSANLNASIENQSQHHVTYRTLSSS